MAVNTNLYAIQKVMNAKIFDLVTGECLGMVMKAKSTNLTADAETTFATGGIGNTKGVAFTHSKVASLEFVNAYIDLMFQGSVLGATPTTGSNSNFVMTDIITVNTNTGLTQFTASGTVGSELLFAYLQNTDGTLGTKFTQAATPSAGKFSYTSGTKTITFNTGEVTNGSKVVVFYNTPTGASTKTLSNKTNLGSKEVKLVCDTLVTNTCDGTEYGAQLIFYKAKVGNNFSLELSADGEPATQSISFEALSNCTSASLFDLIIYDTNMTT